jgi:hypothetical protein
MTVQKGSVRLEKVKNIAADRRNKLQSNIAEGKPHSNPATTPLAVQIGAQQVLKVTVDPEELGYGREEFYAKMGGDGRIAVPKLTLKLLQGEDEESLVGSVFEVKLEPAEGAS